MESETSQKDLPKSLPQGLKKLGKLERFCKGEMLFSAQDEAKGFYYLKNSDITEMGMLPRPFIP